MLISCIQTKLRFPYSHFDTSTDDMERRMHCAKMDIDEGFEMMEHAGREGAQLMVTIEGFNGHIGYSDPRFVDHLEPLDGPLIKRFSNVARKYGSYIVAGLFTGRNGKAYNSGVLIGLTPLPALPRLLLPSMAINPSTLACTYFIHSAKHAPNFLGSSPMKTLRNVSALGVPRSNG